MDGSIVLGGSQRNRSLMLYRKGPDPQVTPRAHVILLPPDGHEWTVTAAVLFCSTATIARRNMRFERDEVERCWNTTTAAGRCWAGAVRLGEVAGVPATSGMPLPWCCAARAVVAPFDIVLGEGEQRDGAAVAAHRDPRVTETPRVFCSADPQT